MAALAHGHLEPGSLSSPRAGAAYVPGGTVVARWVQSQYHAGTYRFHFSPDGGATWSETGSQRASGADGDTVAFAWTVPAAPTEKGRFRVCQPGASCTDPDYRLESGDFAIRTGAAVRASRPSSQVRLRSARTGGNLEVSFEPGNGAPVDLGAFDARGARVATLLRGHPGPGPHTVRPSRGLDRGTTLVIRLEAGGRLEALPLPPSR